MLYLHAFPPKGFYFLVLVILIDIFTEFIINKYDGMILLAKIKLPGPIFIAFQ